MYTTVVFRVLFGGPRLSCSLLAPQARSRSMSPRSGPRLPADSLIERGEGTKPGCSLPAIWERIGYADPSQIASFSRLRYSSVYLLCPC